MSLNYMNINDALPNLLHRVLSQGTVIESRAGKTLEITMQQILLIDPSRQKEITVAGRRASLPAQIAETMWILSGRNDVEWLSHYLPRAAEFSDDGETWRGGYGPRLRAWEYRHDGEKWDAGIDQLKHIVDLLTNDPGTRRAVFNIYNPQIDTEPGKDIPCNNWVHFLPRGGVLHAHVAIRSNDLFWGWSGINAFEWTSLLQVVAGLAGMVPGGVTFSISSLHLYERHWAKAREIVDTAKLQGIGGQRTFASSPAFAFVGTVGQLDQWVGKWFQLEGQIRKGGLSDALLEQIRTFPEPMMKSWLEVLLAWHHDDKEFLREYEGTALFEAFCSSPKMKKPEPTPVVEFRKPSPARAQFTVFATKLHAEKNAAYGDSWKKRGEMLGIMANIARKVDRLGVPGGGDTAADTAIDLLVYLIKYNLWLRQQAGAQDAPTEGKSHVAAVDFLLQHLEKNAPNMTEYTEDQLIGRIRSGFDHLEHLVEEKRATRSDYVRTLIDTAYPLAVRLWWAEGTTEGKAIEAFQSHAERNATRRFDGYSTADQFDKTCK